MSDDDQDLCANCGKRLATINWVVGSEAGRSDGSRQWWCEICVATAQLEYALERSITEPVFSSMVPLLRMRRAFYFERRGEELEPESLAPRA